MNYKVSFLGLGVMGYPMAGYLARAGHDVTVYNRTASKAERWVTEHGGSAAPTPAAAAEGRDFVLCCVGNDDDLRSVVLGDDGALGAMASGSIFVDHTTASAAVAAVAASTPSAASRRAYASASRLMIRTRAADLS